MEPTAPGDPESPLRWTSKSVRVLSVALEALGHAVSHTVVAELLHELGYSLQGNANTQKGKQHPDRDAQFRHIAREVSRFQRQRQPAISVPPEELGNGGRVQWVSGRPGEAPEYAGTDFIIARDGRIAAVYLFFDKLS